MPEAKMGKVFKICSIDLEDSLDLWLDLFAVHPIIPTIYNNVIWPTLTKKFHHFVIGFCLLALKRCDANAYQIPPISPCPWLPQHHPLPHLDPGVPH